MILPIAIPPRHTEQDRMVNRKGCISLPTGWEDAADTIYIIADGMVLDLRSLRICIILTRPSMNWLPFTTSRVIRCFLVLRDIPAMVVSICSRFSYPLPLIPG